MGAFDNVGATIQGGGAPAGPAPGSYAALAQQYMNNAQQWQGGGVNQDTVNYIRGLNDPQLQYGALMALGGNNSNPTFTAAANALMPGAYSSAGGTSADFAHFLDQGSRGMLDPNMQRNGPQWQDVLSHINGAAGSQGYTGNDYSTLTQPGQQQTMNATPAAGGQSQSMPGPWNMTPGSYPDAQGFGGGYQAPGGGAADPGGGAQAPGGGSAPPPNGQAPSLGNMMQPQGGGGNVSIPDASGNYPLNVSQYLNPYMNFAMQQGMNALNSSLGATGQLNSGAAMRGIEDYAQGLAGSMGWNPAMQTAQQQQGFNFGAQQTGFQDVLQQAMQNANIGNMQNQYNLGLGQLGIGQQMANANIGNMQNQYGLQQAALSGQLGAQQQQLALQQLGMLLNAGTTAAGQQAGAAGIYGNSIAQLMAMLGQTQGTGTIGAGNAWNTGIGNAINNGMGQMTLGNLMQWLQQQNQIPTLQ
jgi:hypothetical protein